MGGFQFEKFKSLDHWGGRVFFIIWGIGGRPICSYGGGGKVGGSSDKVNQRGAKQLSYYKKNFCQGKKNFYSDFQRKNSFDFCIISFKGTCVNCNNANFKRVASSHEKLYNEQWIIFYVYVTLYYDFLIHSFFYKNQ